MKIVQLKLKNNNLVEDVFPKTSIYAIENLDNTLKEYEISLKNKIDKNELKTINNLSLIGEGNIELSKTNYLDYTSSGINLNTLPIGLTIVKNTDSKNNIYINKISSQYVRIFGFIDISNDNTDPISEGILKSGNYLLDVLYYNPGDTNFYYYCNYNPNLIREELKLKITNNTSVIQQNTDKINQLLSNLKNYFIINTIDELEQANMKLGDKMELTLIIDIPNVSYFLWKSYDGNNILYTRVVDLENIATEISVYGDRYLGGIIDTAFNLDEDVVGKFIHSDTYLQGQKFYYDRKISDNINDLSKKVSILTSQGYREIAVL